MNLQLVEDACVLFPEDYEDDFRDPSSNDIMNLQLVEDACVLFPGLST
jgi:hypothetical protein